MKNQIRAPKKALSKTAKKQPETPHHPYQRIIEPLIPGRYRPSLNEDQTCAVIALAIHNARPDLERVCDSFIEYDLEHQAARLADCIAIAGAVVRFQVLQCLDESDRPRALQPALPGLLGMCPLSLGEALLEMAATLHEMADEFRSHPFESATAYAEVAEAVMLSEEVLHINKVTWTEYTHAGRGRDFRNTTGMQREAWRAKIVAITSRKEPWRARVAEQVAAAKKEKQTASAA